MIGGVAINPSGKFGKRFDMWKKGFVVSLSQTEVSQEPPHLELFRRRI